MKLFNDEEKYENDEKNKQLILNCTSKKVSLDLNEDEKSEKKMIINRNQ